MARSDNDSDNASIHNEAPNNHQQPNIQIRIITTVSNNNAKFSYLRRVSMSLKRTGRDNDGGLIILPPTTAEEYLAVQRESKARTTLLQSIPNDHIANFHYMDDARDIWNAIKARFGGNVDYKKIRKSMLKQDFSKFRISEAEGLHKGECRSKGGNDKQRYSSFKINEIGKKEEYSKALVTFDTLVDWIKHDSESDGVIAAKEFGMITGCDSRDTLKEGSDNDSDNASIHNEAPNNHQQPNIQIRIITTVSNNNAKFSYLKKGEYENAIKARFGGNVDSKKIRKSMLKQDFSKFRISKAKGLHKGYDRRQKIMSQVNQLKAKTKGGLEFISFDDLHYKLKTLEVDIKGYNTFSSSQSTGPSHSIFVSATSTNKKMSYRDSLTHSLTTTYSVPSNSKTGSYKTGNVIKDVLQSFVADTEPEQHLAYEDLEQIDKLDLEEMDLKWQMAMLSVRVHKFEQKARRKIDFDKKESARFNKQKIKHDSESDGVIAAKEFGMIAGCDSRDTLKEGTAKLYNLINGANSEEANTTSDAGEFAFMGVTSETKLDNHLARTEKWRNSSKNLFKLIDNSMSIKTKVGLGFTNCIGENKLGWDDSAFNVFTTNSEDVEGRPIFHSDKSSEVNTNDFASSDSSVKSSEHQPNDSTSYASTSSVSTLVNEVENESNVGKPIKEPISVQDLPSFTCNSSDKTKHTSRTSCNQNSSFNKKAGHFRKYASSISKLCFTTTIPTGKPKVKPVPTGKPKATPVPIGKPRMFTPVRTSRPNVKPIPTSKPKVTPVLTGKPQVFTPVRTSRPNVKPIPTSKPKVTPVLTGKPQVFTPVPTGRPNWPFSVPTGRGYTLLLMSGWWSHTASPMPHQ
nr:ribonuclease H-like domain-containing protein [Tanacetum cinerariifolium]